MRSTILLTLSLCLAAASAADQPPQLDPRKPADAVQVVDLLTRQLALPRDQAVGLTVAIETLAGVVREREAAQAKAAEPKPVEPAKAQD
jgi:hypothetical protein